MCPLIERCVHLSQLVAEPVGVPTEGLDERWLISGRLVSQHTIQLVDLSVQRAEPASERSARFVLSVHEPVPFGENPPSLRCLDLTGAASAMETAASDSE